MNKRSTSVEATFFKNLKDFGFASRLRLTRNGNRNGGLKLNARLNFAPKKIGRKFAAETYFSAFRVSGFSAPTETLITIFVSVPKLPKNFPEKFCSLI